MNAVPTEQYLAPNPAPDLETLYDVETAVERAVKAVLQSDYPGPNGIRAFTQFEFEDGAEDLPAERVDVQLQLGGQTGNKFRTPTGLWVRRAWAGVLTFTVWSKRLRGKPSFGGKTRARVRHSVEYFQGKLGPDILPYHCLTSIVHRDSDPGVNVDDDLDVCAIAFDVVVSIREGAWPAA